MNTNRTRELDSFESALLTELRNVVAEQASTPAVPTTSPYAAGRVRRPRPVRWAAASVVGLAAAALGVTTLASPAAYAISQEDNGDVTVTINRLESPEELEAELASYGITADVTYTPPGKVCAPGRFTPAADENGGQSTASTDSGGTTRLTFPRGSIKAGQTLVLESMWPDERSWVMSQAVAQGSVGPCDLVDFVPPQGEPEPKQG